MRTKTLILTAALSVAGVMTSQAAVYSVNAVGYVNRTLEPGYNLISNPLNSGNNTIGNLFKDLPDGTQVFKFTGSGFRSATKDVTYEPADVAALTANPGEGVFVRVNARETVTFVGEVPQGSLSIDVPQGLSIRSSLTPQGGAAAIEGFPAQDGDQIFQYDNVTKAYRSSTFDAGWQPDLRPLVVGEAFFVRKGAAGTWSRNFSVNP